MVRKQPEWTGGVGAALAVVVAVLVLGLGARVICIREAPQSAYLRDHISNMGWGTYAVEHGPWNLYDLPENQPLVVQKRDERTDRLFNAVDLNVHPCNYPPMGAYLYWIQGLVWHALDDEVVTLRTPPWAARYNVTQATESRVIDTRVSRTADASTGIVFDLFLAWGVAALVRALTPERRRRILESIAFAITMLAPPMFLDSSYWCQADSWIACLLVWCLVFLMRARLLLAGVIFGVALMTKPQAVLFMPVLVYVFFALRFKASGSWRDAFGLWKPSLAALVTAAVIAAPFMIADGVDEHNPDGVFRWFKRSYVGTIGGDQYARITLNAFNIWWLDQLSQGMPPPKGDAAAQRAFFTKLYSPDEQIAGISKGVWGKLLLGFGIVLAWVLCARKWRWSEASWPVCTFIVMLAAFTLPTSVHERYIYYCLPFAIALAVHERKWIAPMVALMIVGTFEMTSYAWADIRNIFDPAKSARMWSGVLAWLTVLSLAYAFAVLIPRSSLKKHDAK